MSFIKKQKISDLDFATQGVMCLLGIKKNTAYRMIKNKMIFLGINEAKANEIMRSAGANEVREHNWGIEYDSKNEHLVLIHYGG